MRTVTYTVEYSYIIIMQKRKLDMAIDNNHRLYRIAYFNKTNMSNWETIYTLFILYLVC